MFIQLVIIILECLFMKLTFSTTRSEVSLRLDVFISAKTDSGAVTRLQT